MRDSRAHSLVGAVGIELDPSRERSPAELRVWLIRARIRYAPLSSGLDIVRKTLSQHEIATFRLLRLMKRLALFASAPFWPMPPENG